MVVHRRAHGWYTPWCIARTSSAFNSYYVHAFSKIACHMSCSVSISTYNTSRKFIEIIYDSVYGSLLFIFRKEICKPLGQWPWRKNTLIFCDLRENSSMRPCAFRDRKEPHGIDTRNLVGESREQLHRYKKSCIGLRHCGEHVFGIIR